MQLTKSGATLGGALADRPPLSLHHGAMMLALWCVLLANATTLHAQQPARTFRMGLLVPTSSQAPPAPSITAFLKRATDLSAKRVEMLREAVPSLPRMAVLVSLKAAKALGLTIPQSVLVRADEVIR